MNDSNIHPTSEITTLSDSEELILLRQTMELHHTAICRWNLSDHTISWSNNAAQVLHLGKNTSTPNTIDAWIESIAEEDRERFALLKESMTKTPRNLDMEYSLHLSHPTGRLRVRHIGKIIKQGEHTEVLGTIVTSHPLEVVDKEKNAAYVTHDLPDRRSNDRTGYHYPPAFMKHLYEAITHSTLTKEPGTFMLLAINNLAMIVNGYGFEKSEHIIQEIKFALARALNPHDKIERIHRDQIGIVLVDCDKFLAERRAVEFKNIIQNLSMRADFGPLHVTCTIGSVGFPEPARNVAEALDKAYVALNNNSPSIHHAFEDNDTDSEKSRQQMSLANYLHDAIRENRLRLAYQPIIAAETGQVAHYECLLRIIDKNGKLSSAGPLIPIAERMGLIEIIDRLVVEKTVQELRNHPTVSLAFNISNVTTGNQEWVRYLASLLGDDLAVASRMIVEITETAAQRDLRETAYFVASVQALGCQVSLDDFGSGYTSFRQLKALSVDMLKIDGAFIRDLVDNADNRFFVKTLLDFTTGYGLKAVAEYVESGEIAKMLMELGVEYMQGYYFSQPLNYRPWLNEGEYNPS